MNPFVAPGLLAVPEIQNYKCTKPGCYYCLAFAVQEPKEPARMSGVLVASGYRADCWSKADLAWLTHCMSIQAKYLKGTFEQYRSIQAINAMKYYIKVRARAKDTRLTRSRNMQRIVSPPAPVRQSYF